MNMPALVNNDQLENLSRSSKQGSPALSLGDSASRASPFVSTPPELPLESPLDDQDFSPSLSPVEPETLSQGRNRPQTKHPKLVVLPGDYDATATEKTTCHVCRTRSKRIKMNCNQPGCNKKFCAPCMRTRHAFMPEYQAPDFTFVADHSFKCPFCRNNCQCSVCTNRRGRKTPSGEFVVRRKRTNSDRGYDARDVSLPAVSATPKERTAKKRAALVIRAETSSVRRSIPTAIWTGPIDHPPENEDEGYGSTLSMEFDGDKSNPLHSQRKLVRALGVGQRPPASPGLHNATCLTGDSGVNIDPLERDIFDDFLLCYSPVNAGFSSPGFANDDFLSHQQIHQEHYHSAPCFSCAWSGPTSTALNGGAPSYLEP